MRDGRCTLWRGRLPSEGPGASIGAGRVRACGRVLRTGQACVQRGHGMPVVDKTASGTPTSCIARERKRSAGDALPNGDRGSAEPQECPWAGGKGSAEPQECPRAAWPPLALGFSRNPSAVALLRTRLAGSPPRLLLRAGSHRCSAAWLPCTLSKTATCSGQFTRCAPTALHEGSACSRGSVDVVRPSARMCADPKQSSDLVENVRPPLPGHSSGA